MPSTRQNFQLVPTRQPNLRYDPFDIARYTEYAWNIKRKLHIQMQLLKLLEYMEIPEYILILPKQSP